MHCVGFEPFFDSESKILILGSFPSVKSREVNFYYGHPQNRFWKTLAELFSEPVPVTAEEKKALLKSHRIALWDIVIECDIEGSMDANIRCPKIAPIDKLLLNTKIERIFCNGQKSYSLTLKSFPQLADKITLLPSTSPANGRFRKSEWAKILNI